MSARFAKLILMICCCALMSIPASQVWAQDPGDGGNGGDGGGNPPVFGNGNTVVQTGVVGGITIDPSGMISPDKQVVDERLRQLLQDGMNHVDADINEASDLRMISLRGLEAAITQARDEGRQVPQDAQFMAGLQRIEYIILSPENNDVIIAGPGEGWKLDDDGNVVGVNSGRPVIQLEDFLVAMRSADQARTGQGISVSIDPTEEGVQQLQKLFNSLNTFRPEMRADVEKAMGQHVITLTGVPEDSRFSQILVAADYRMKRLSMGLEESPIDGLPSFMEIAVSKNAKRIRSAPRFWMECNYEPVAKSADGTVWQIRGQGVKTMTQESHFDKDGKRSTTKKQNRFAVQWAESMTEKFEELSAADPAFAELRNVMDMSVIAAIIKGERLAESVDLEMPEILGMSNAVATPSWTVPKTVSTECSFVKLSGDWLVSASGGIQLDSWGVAENTETVGELAKLATKATPNKDRWWWNAK
jgi:hypothetical protein